jgi:hypothetical protein
MDSDKFTLSINSSIIEESLDEAVIKTFFHAMHLFRCMAVSDEIIVLDPDGNVDRKESFKDINMRYNNAH